MSDALRDHDPEKTRALEHLRHHGIAVSDVAIAPLPSEENADDPGLSATQMLEWLRKSPGWITSKR